MQITQLRLHGFKSFVEHTDLLVTEGLTGVVGPNGCGKSNLLEALRWVMGETSTKSMRASQMEDVIFSGTDRRPARNMAEVVVHLDNSARTAPAAFNDADTIEIVRRIERDAGSAYRINGRDVRARDVRLLFEDAATGARSNALVRQGQIGEIVNAKPDKRRRLLEDAAGIAGLHSRRHEAELRLRAAEGNLDRVDDILGQIHSQMNGLKRQARQARRYREITEEIRKSEAIAYHLAWRAAEAGVLASEAELREILAEVARATSTEAEGRSELERLSEDLQPHREHEATKAAVLQRVQIEIDGLEREMKEAAERYEDVVARTVQTEADLEREKALLAEAETIATRLAQEADRLKTASAQTAKGLDPAREEVSARQAEYRTADSALQDLTTQCATHQSERRQLERVIADCEEAAEHTRARLTKAQDEKSRVVGARSSAGDIAALKAQLSATQTEMNAAENAVSSARSHKSAAMATLEAAHRSLADMLLTKTRLATQVETLERYVSAAAPGESKFPSIIEQIEVTGGYEKAVGAALGDDINASLDARAQIHWSNDNGLAATAAPAALPEGVRPITDFMSAPRELTRRLSQIGLADDALAPDLARQLQPGQRLVTVAGALYRWDGLVQRADAPSAAANRLEERNRLTSLKSELKQAITQLGVEEENAEQAKQEFAALRHRPKRSTRRLALHRACRQCRPDRPYRA